MPSIRDDLQRQLQEVLLADLPTPVPSPVTEKLSQDLVTTVGRWLRDTYEVHSLEEYVFGEPSPRVIRPSFEWLCETMAG